MSTPRVRRAAFSELDAATLYAILRLRVDVFVVEQRCPYRELDGRDTEPGTRHLWIEDPAGTVVACLRTLSEPDGVTRIGRVATAPAARGAGLAALLVRAATAHTEGRVVLDAQAHLRGWYERLGFVVSGARYVDDGIPHVPMALTGRRS